VVGGGTLAVTSLGHHIQAETALGPNFWRLTLIRSPRLHLVAGRSRSHAHIPTRNKTKRANSIQLIADETMISADRCVGAEAGLGKIWDRSGTVSAPSRRAARPGSMRRADCDRAFPFGLILYLSPWGRPQRAGPFFTAAPSPRREAAARSDDPHDGSRDCPPASLDGAFRCRPLNL